MPSLARGAQLLAGITRVGHEIGGYSQDDQASINQALAAGLTPGPGGTASRYVGSAPTTPAAPAGPPPQAAGAAMLPQLLSEYNQIGSATQPFMQGPVGQSPIFQQQMENFKNLTMPVIQNQFALQGLGGSPALGQAIGVSAGNAMVPLMNQDAQNRLAAIRLAQERVGGAGQLQQQQQELDQMAALRAAQISDAASGRQLQALGLAGQFGQYGGNQLNQLADQMRQRQELSLNAYGSAGQAQRDVQQQAYDSAYADYLRRQGLSEASSTGLFGGSVLPPTLSQASTTKTSSSK